MSNPTFKPSEGKREEFRKYLEKNGVMDALTKVLVNLYEEPEKPEDALEYIRDRLALQAGLEIYSQIKTRMEEYEAKITDLNKEIEELRIKGEPPGDETVIAGAAAPEGEPEVQPETLPEGEVPQVPPPEGENAPEAEVPQVAPPEGENPPEETPVVPVEPVAPAEEGA